VLNVVRIYIIIFFVLLQLYTKKQKTYILFFKLNMIEKSSVNDIKVCNIFYTKCILLIIKAIKAKKKKLTYIYQRRSQ